MQFAASVINGISAGSAGSAVTGSIGKADAKGDSSVPFADLFSESVGQIGELEDQARAATRGLMTGSGVDVHEVMIATQKASMAFELALAVRNKAVQAYQSVMGMQF